MGRDLLRSQNDLISSPFGQGQSITQSELPIANGIIGSSCGRTVTLPSRPEVAAPQNRKLELWIGAE